MYAGLAVAPLGIYYGIESGVAAYEAYTEGDWVTGTKRLIDTVDIAAGFLSGRRVLKALRGPLKSAPKKVARTNAQLVQDIATRAGRWAHRSRQQTSLAGLTARGIGTKQHTYSKRLLDRYQRIYGERGLSTEVRYLNGRPWKPGQPVRDTVRLDVVEYGPQGLPTAVFDYKFGKAGLTTSRINQIRTGAGLSRSVPVIEVRP